MAFHWRADNGPLLELFGPLSPYQKKKEKKWTSLAKLSLSAHELILPSDNTDTNILRVIACCVAESEAVFCWLIFVCFLFLFCFYFVCLFFFAKKTKYK